MHQTTKIQSSSPEVDAAIQNCDAVSLMQRKNFAIQAIVAEVKKNPDAKLPPAEARRLDLQAVLDEIYFSAYQLLGDRPVYAHVNLTSALSILTSLVEADKRADAQQAGEDAAS